MKTARLETETPAFETSLSRAITPCIAKTSDLEGTARDLFKAVGNAARLGLGFCIPIWGIFRQMSGCDVRPNSGKRAFVGKGGGRY